MAQFPNNWSHGNMHGLNEISEIIRGPKLEFNSSMSKVSTTHSDKIMPECNFRGAQISKNFIFFCMDFKNVKHKHSRICEKKQVCPIKKSMGFIVRVGKQSF